MSEFVEQQKLRCFPMSLVIDCFIPHTDLFPEFLHNLRLSDLFNLPGETVPMNPEIFSAMRAGNTDFLEKMRSYTTPMACLKNDKGDSILHLAAAMGHHGLVERIIFECPCLLLEPNWKDQIPLHAAAHAGRLAVVKTLVESITHFSAKILSVEERERFDVYVLKDIDGDIPLHSALKGRHLKTALCLVNASNQGSFLENISGISPLYMAAEAGHLALVKAMMNGLGNNVQGQSSNLASNLQGRKSLVHAALTAKNIDIIDAILNEEPSLVNERDEKGRTCLSLGASVGYNEGVCYLLDRSTSSVFECNSDGSFPIHIAVEKGHFDVVKEIVKRCPDSKELLNKHGQNILHIAAKSRKTRSLILRHIKTLDKKTNHLIEEQDKDGNTPLHLATINWRPHKVRDLTMFSSNTTKILNMKNREGLRPLDIAELDLQSDYIFRERMTLMVLLSVYKPNGCERIPTSGMTLRSKSDILDPNKYKDRVNALLLVAALVATVAFAAGFTVPGGFNSFSPKNLGMAILVHDYHFTLFVVADILAMHSSLVAIVALIWAQMGDPDLVHKAFRTALPSLSLALYSMSFAFYFGVLATTRQCYFLIVIINVVHVIFTCVFTRLLAPYVGPYVSFHLFEWPMHTYIRILLRFVDEDVAEVHHTSGSGQTYV